MKYKLIGLLFLLSLSPIVAFAHSYGEEDWTNHMGFMGTNWGNHMGFMGGGWMMIIWIGLLILVIISVVKWVVTPKRELASTRDAFGILAER